MTNNNDSSGSGTYQIICGDALTVLRTMPAESVHCVVTSPPFWGLRDYKIAPQIWDGDPSCSHKWGAFERTPWANHLPGPNGRKKNIPTSHSARPKETGPFCQKCGAWRGALGLEPTPNLYLTHIIQVFREVWRVLRNDGTCWINLGDSYAADAGTDRKPTTLAGPRVPSGWSNRSQPIRPHASRRGKDCDPKRKTFAEGQPYNGSPCGNGLKPKDLCMMPARVALALQADGWYLRADIIWHKTNPMPESVKDRPTKAHEYLFLLTKSQRYYYNAEAIKEPASPDTHARYARGRSDNHKWADGGPGNPRDRRNGVNPKCAEPGSGIRQNSSFSAAVKDIVERRNKRSVWTINTQPFKGAHFATFPEKLVEPCILAGSHGAGKACDCDELILTPIGEGPTDDPTLFIGRAGYNRQRRLDEGRRVITRREQREYARQIRNSPHRAKMQKICGEAFSHYIRTDRSGARPLPEKLLQRFLKRGWLKVPTSCECPSGRPGLVLDPFAGSGTVGVVALRHGRSFIGIELNESYCTMARERIAKSQQKPEREQAQTTPRHSAVSDVSPKQSAVEVLKG